MYIDCIASKHVSNLNTVIHNYCLKYNLLSISTGIKQGIQIVPLLQPSDETILIQNQYF